MRFLPLHWDTKSKSILLFGGGRAAEAKLRTLRKTDAVINIVASELSDEVAAWIETSERLGWHSVDINSYKPDDALGDKLVALVKKADLIYVATEDKALNSRIAQMARAVNVWVNTADQKNDCDFYMPAIIDRAPVTIAVGTQGQSPALARALKTEIESLLPASFGLLAERIGEVREKLARKFTDSQSRQRFWGKLFGEGSLKDILRLTPNRFEALATEAFAAKSGAEDNAGERKNSKQISEPLCQAGHVSLVGAGPGSADLLTLSALRKLQLADVIVYDRLVGADILDIARREAEFIYAGKKPYEHQRPGAHKARQDSINDILIAEARKGQLVVRLKGGDPLIFGRADEEMAALDQAGVSYDIVPGITAAAAAAASIKVSLTSRGKNKAVTFLTGQDSQGYAELDWRALAKEGSRAAIYMGLGAARFIQGRLLLFDAEADRPVTLVENASLPQEKVVVSTLGNLPYLIENNDIKSPVILLLGYQPHQQSAALNSARSLIK